MDTPTPELDMAIQQAWREWFRLQEEARPIKSRISNSNHLDHSLTDDEIRVLLAPDKKFNELYELLCRKYPELSPDA